MRAAEQKGACPSACARVLAPLYLHVSFSHRGRSDGSNSGDEDRESEAATALICLC